MTVRRYYAGKNKEAIVSRFKVGDRVHKKGVKPDSSEYDTGTIVGFTFDNAKVHWESADEIYTENQAVLEALDNDETTDTLTHEMIKQLFMGGDISLDDAVVAIGLRAAKRGDSRKACRARVALVAERILLAGRIKPR